MFHRLQLAGKILDFLAEKFAYEIFFKNSIFHCLNGFNRKTLIFAFRFASFHSLISLLINTLLVREQIRSMKFRIVKPINDGSI